MIVAIVALIMSLGGSAFAVNKQRKNFRPGKNSVGSRQLKAKSVKTGKIANNAVNGRKVANNSLTGDDINLGALGTVPTAQSAAQAGNANTVGGHAAACPGGTILIRGVCYDAGSHPPVTSLKAAADSCAAKGGYLPDPMQLYSTRTILNLGTGVETDKQYTDTYYGNSIGTVFKTMVIDGTGTLTEQDPDTDAEYICAYPLVR